MAKEEKSVIEQALLEAQQIDETFNANAKEILTRTMGSEIEEMVKESLEGSPKAINEDEDDDMDLATDLEIGGGDLDLDLGDNEEDELDLDLGDSDDDLDLDMDVVDLTDMDDEQELIRVFKGMDPEDEIEVVQTDSGIEFTDNETGAEYKIELGDEVEIEDELEDEDEDEMELGLDGDEEVIDLDGGDTLEIEDDEEEEVVYEIEITGEDDDEDEDVKSENRGAATLGNASEIANRKSSNIGDNRKKIRKESRQPRIDTKLVKENKVLKHKLNGLESENKELKESQEKMVDALKQFRQKLQEVAVFNSNLAHVVRLFTENTTTKEEKVEIVKRMDEAKSLKESKTMFKTIAKELEGTKTTKTIQESVDDKVNKTASTGSKEIITESQVYVHPEIDKMRKMWEFNYKY
jgi:hypothetical protein